MKRLLGFILFLSTIMPVFAQETLQVERLFDTYRKHPHAVELLVKGKELKSFNLTLFRSLTMSKDAAARKRIEEAVLADTKDAVDKEEGMLGGRLYYGFYCLSSSGKKNRYLFYRNSALRANTSADESIVIYMEGYASLEELKRMFK